jgi:hypothetical protein
MTFMYPPHPPVSEICHGLLRALMLFPRIAKPMSQTLNLRVPFALDVECASALPDFASFLISFVELLRRDNNGKHFTVYNLSYACGFRSLYGVIYICGDLGHFLSSYSGDNLDLFMPQFGVDVVSWPFDDNILRSPQSVINCLSMAL